MNRSVASVMENAIGLLCQLLRTIVFEAKEDSALPVARERTLKKRWWRLTGGREGWWWRSSPFPRAVVPALWPMTSSGTSNSHYLSFTVVFVVIMSGKGQANLSTRFVQLGLPINFYSTILRTVKRRESETRYLNDLTNHEEG